MLLARCLSGRHMQELKDIEFTSSLIEVKTEKVHFSKLQNWLIDTNILCMLHSQALLLYLVLLRRSKNGKYGFIYTDQIIKSTNIHKSHISRYIKQLVFYKLITITGQSKTYSYKKYRINGQTQQQDSNV
jgi:hypothetical protein